MLEHAGRWLLAAVVVVSGLGLCPCPAEGAALPSASATPAADDPHACCEGSSAPTPVPDEDDGCCVRCDVVDAQVRPDAGDAAVQRLVLAGSFPLVWIPLSGPAIAVDAALNAGPAAWPPVRPDAAPTATLRALHTLLLV